MPRMIAPRLLAWWNEHGRKDLPWQRGRNPYRVWVSEIMLQQTRAATVVPYFERFMAAFPDLETLAKASGDEVLALWAGLGYYSRAHNLLKAARIVVRQHGGQLPEDPEQLLALPGIGRSTAGAILAQAYGKRYPILDANARRVLARLYAVDGWPGKASVSKRLWRLADINTPSQGIRDYTQAIMDLGATVCLAGEARCGLCPLADSCKALLLGRTAEIPASRPPARRPLRRQTMAVVQRPDGAVLLQRRPPAGVWAGLWCLPELEQDEGGPAWCQKVLQCAAEPLGELPPFRHGFSHFELEIQPLRLILSKPEDAVREAGQWLWYDGTQAIGMPAPISRFLNGMDSGPATPR